MRNISVLVLLLVQLGSAQAFEALDATDEFIREYSEMLGEGSKRAVAGQDIAAAALVSTFYARRGFHAAWGDTPRLQALLQLLRSAEEHGLNSDDYHYRVLSTWTDESDPAQRAARDLIATDALVRFGYHLHLGKVDPNQLDSDWNLTRTLSNDEPIAVLERTVAAPVLADFVAAELAPNGPLYAGMRTALARYRAIARAGGWPPMPAGPTLRPGERAERVAALRARLRVTDAELDAKTSDEHLFDTNLAAAVTRFQLRHGLDGDGSVGVRTLAALNVPVAARIDQLRVNLERTRWVFRDHEPRYLIVNIAGFRAYLVENRKVVWESRVQVGKPFRKTPVFKATMTYLVLNPTWTVPPTVLKDDLIPKIQRNPAFLAQNDMVLLDRAGRPVDINTVDVRSVTPEHFPYSVRQEPGPKNALGRVKFMFPNKHFIYLHDTPNRRLFDRSERTFSSGCIRVEHPITLASLLLGNSTQWSEAQIEEKLKTAKNETVKLKKPITVFLMYWTSEPDEHGDARFFGDVYALDQAVLHALQEPFRLVAMR